MIMSVPYLCIYILNNIITYLMCKWNYDMIRPGNSLYEYVDVNNACNIV